MLVPGTSGHPGTTSPRGLAIALDAVHLAAGSIWIGGLIGLLVLWRGVDRPRSSPRFSNVAIGAVLALIATGIGAAILHLPTLASLWETGYGQALLVKIALLLVALLLAAVNLLRTRPRLLAGPRAPSGRAGRAARSSWSPARCSPPRSSRASPRPPRRSPTSASRRATVGPGPVAKTVERNGYTLELGVAPNRAAANNRFEVALTKDGKPVQGAA